ncbi:glycine cleavage system aminomethyltransferase GcvT [Paenibacillus glycanilyticus]|uniref:glycine cleavage system aminomethyltransferase GcvT n=1 Tax=Paenibacillus glycanilyticus TaxID=126569 RepID=UPI00203CEDF4|nr:glycine cleavage system aminomethyltransferase GcvT [Paenibacillus glycanilyticus]MCM3627668.1 glycine cleavage system aminomethyltransferase GcvT [Paenibacillus glycanilyticus]
MTLDLKRTPLYPFYSDYTGVRCIDFGGWELPVQFSGIQQEHAAVRQQAGLFDVSHMGEFMVTGTFAESFLQRMTTNDVSNLADGQAQYTLMCYPDGGVVDDLLVYRISADQFMVVVNASNIDKDFSWLEEHLIGDVVMENMSDRTALLALQGPLAVQILKAAGADSETLELSSFHFRTDIGLTGSPTLISRTGYTGEDGFEIYVPAEQAGNVWNSLLAAGEPFGLLPAGLGARDTLRFEARLPLYGQELSSTISPLEAGLSFFVKLSKENFIGKDALVKQKTKGLPRKLVGVEMIDRGIPRCHYSVYAGDALIGEITTGTQSPTLKRNLGLALIDSRYSALGTELEVDIRGKRLKAAVIPTPFYKRLPKE